MKWSLRSLGMYLGAIGFDPSRAMGLRDLPRFLRDMRAFRTEGGTVDAISPVLADYRDSAGSARGHYFRMDLLVAEMICRTQPQRHVDIGSRIDGFVAHVASFRQIEVLDVRPMSPGSHPNIRFLQGNAMDQAAIAGISADSVSLLHALEHFGLGCYGDPIDPQGHLKGFRNLVSMVRPDGRLYLAVPLGRRDEVSFNAHRVFHVGSPSQWADETGVLSLERFSFVDDAGDLHRDVDVADVPGSIEYGCGIYVFRRTRKNCGC